MKPAAHGFTAPTARARTIALLCWIGVALTAWAIRSGHAQGIDRAGLLIWRDAALQPRAAAALLEPVRDITALGGVLVRNMVALGVVVGLMFAHRRREALWFALTVMTGWLACSALKALVARARPDIVPHLMEAGGNSFPSGHSFNSAVVYMTMALTFAAFTTRPAVRVTMVGAAIALSLAIAWSRIWLGVHWPSDVVAGWLGGAGWATLASSLRGGTGPWAR